MLVDMLAAHDRKYCSDTAKIQDRALLAIRQASPERLMEGLRKVASKEIVAPVLGQYLRMAKSSIAGGRLPETLIRR